MVDICLTAFRNYLELNLPTGRVKTFLANHPTPNVKLVYPALSIIPFKPQITRYSQREVGTSDSTKTINGQTINTRVHTYINGEFTTSVRLHYMALSRDDRASFITELFALFAGSQVEGGQNSSLYIPYGAEDWEKCKFTLMGYDFINSSESIRSEEIRVVFDIILDNPSVLQTSVSTITDVDFDLTQTKIGEKVRPE